MRETDRALRGHHRQGHFLWGLALVAQGPGGGLSCRGTGKAGVCRHGPVWHRVSERGLALTDHPPAPAQSCPALRQLSSAHTEGRGQTRTHVTSGPGLCSWEERATVRASPSSLPGEPACHNSRVQTVPPGAVLPP